MSKTFLNLVSPEAAAERRQFERFSAAERPVAIIPAEGETELSAWVQDASDGGLKLRLAADAETLKTEAVVALRIDSPERAHTQQVCVRWVKAQGGSLWCGVDFLESGRFDPDSHRLHIDDVRVDPGWAMKIPAPTALRRRVLPFAFMDGIAHVACEDIENTATLELVERLLKSPVQFWEVDPAELRPVLQRVYGETRAAAPSAAATQDSVTAISDDLLYAAYLRQASDIHIDPGPSGMVVRFRVDGKLEFHAELPSGQQTELISRFKVLSGMDIAERRAPQDGRFTFQIPGQAQRVDIRAATLPTKHGERMALRLLALQTGDLTLDRLGLHPAHRNAVEAFLRRSQGMMILTGPTGSGKTTTLYAAIRMLLNERSLNVMTIEDPIEYAIDGIAQCEVDSADKVSFAKALRSILRHDPDVVMIGEIRDGETADIAMKAALTGHLVLGTLHTNSSAATITRLLDMGVEPYLLAGTLRLAISQRLCRKLCSHCRTPRVLTPREALGLNKPEFAGRIVYEPCGCIYCAGRGYNGRTGLYEFLEMNADWARDVASGAGESQLQESMRQAGVVFLEDDAMEKLFSGMIAFDDALQIVNSW